MHRWVKHLNESDKSTHGDTNILPPGISSPSCATAAIIAIASPPPALPRTGNSAIVQVDDDEEEEEEDTQFEQGGITLSCYPMLPCIYAAVLIHIHTCTRSHARPARSRSQCSVWVYV